MYCSMLVLTCVLANNFFIQMMRLFFGLVVAFQYYENCSYSSILYCIWSKDEFKKSKLLDICVEYSVVQEMATNIGCASIKTPFTFLWLSIGDNICYIDACKKVVLMLTFKLCVETKTSLH